MSNGHGQENPANKIATAQATLALARRLNAEVEAGRIDHSVYSRTVTVFTGRSRVHLSAYPEANSTDLTNGIFNIVLIALCASALTVDETLNEVFGPPDSRSDHAN